MVNSLGSAVLTLSTDNAPLQAGLRTAQLQTTRALEELGRGARWTGLALSAAITLPILGIGAAALKSATSFESAFVGVTNTVTDATDREFAHLRDAFRLMASETGTPAEDVANIARKAGELGINVGSVEAFTKAIVDLSVAVPSLDTELAATQMAQFMNIMKTAPAAIDNVANTLFGLEREGAATSKDILALSLRLAGAGAVLGLTEADVLGLANALKSLGLNTESAGSSTSRVMRDLYTATHGDSAGLLENFANVMGLTTDRVIELQATDPKQLLADFALGLGRIKSEGGDIDQTLKGLKLNTIRQANTWLPISNAPDKFVASLGLANTEWAENNALTEAAGKVYETTERKIEKFRQRLTDTARTLGVALLPGLNGLMDAAGPFVAVLAQLATGFAALSPTQQKVIVGVLAFAAAIGPIVFVLGAIASAIGAVSTGFLRLHAMMSVSEAVANASTSAYTRQARSIQTLGQAAKGIAQLSMANEAVGAAVAGRNIATGQVGVAKTGEMQAANNLKKAQADLDRASAAARNADAVALKAQTAAGVQSLRWQQSAKDLGSQHVITLKERERFLALERTAVNASTEAERANGAARGANMRLGAAQTEVLRARQAVQTAENTLVQANTRLTQAQGAQQAASNAAMVTSTGTTMRFAGVQAALASSFSGVTRTATLAAGAGRAMSAAFLANPIGWAILAGSILMSVRAMRSLKTAADEAAAAMAKANLKTETETMLMEMPLAELDQFIHASTIELEAKAKRIAELKEEIAKAPPPPTAPGLLDKISDPFQVGKTVYDASPVKQQQADLEALNADYEFYNDLLGFAYDQHRRVGKEALRSGNLAADGADFAGASFSAWAKEIEGLEVDAMIADLALRIMFSEKEGKAYDVAAAIEEINDAMRTLLDLEGKQAGVRALLGDEWGGYEAWQKLMEQSRGAGSTYEPPTRTPSAPVMSEAEKELDRELEAQKSAIENFNKTRTEMQATALLNDLPSFSKLQNTFQEIERSGLPAMDKIRQQFELLDSFWVNEAIPGLNSLGIANTVMYRDLFESAARAANEAQQAAEAESKRLADMGATARAQYLAQYLVGQGFTNIKDAVASLNPALITMVRGLGDSEKLMADIADEILGVKDAKNEMGSFLDLVLGRKEYEGLSSTRLGAPGTIDTVSNNVNVETMNIHPGATREDVTVAVEGTVVGVRRGSLAAV